MSWKKSKAGGKQVKSSKGGLLLKLQIKYMIRKIIIKWIKLFR